MGELRGGLRVEPEGAVPGRDPEQARADPPEALDRPPSRAFSTYTWSPWTATPTGKAPPLPITWRRVSRLPCTPKTVMVSLPAFTAYSRFRARSRVSDPGEASGSAAAPASMPPRPPVGYVPVRCSPPSYVTMVLPSRPLAWTNTSLVDCWPAAAAPDDWWPAAAAGPARVADW
ncbi:hypothetical protein ACIA5D_05355 [Actinoplanes sp. NPDC051513]|uniref:hypothetical protein n=1 Tax=Actinoplanes sp. NPDC051513 TaxID=3363908 RepID=UPI00378D9EC8